MSEMTKDIEQYLQTKFGNSIEESNERQLYQALMAETRNRLLKKRYDYNKKLKESGQKQAYYMSMEFLVGRTLRNNLFNLGLEEEIRSFLAEKNFDLENIFNTANNLKYTNQLEKVVSAELENPSREFASYFFRKISNQVATEKRVEQIMPLLKAVFAGRINDMVRDRLTSALDKETKKEAEPLPPQEDENKVITTQEELDAFYIVRAILAAVTNVENITYRDAQSYFAIFFNDNNRKPICRLYFTDNKKQIGIMDSEKNETRFQLDRIEDIYAYSEKLCELAKFYASQN